MLMNLVIWIKWSHFWKNRNVEICTRRNREHEQTSNYLKDINGYQHHINYIHPLLIYNPRVKNRIIREIERYLELNKLTDYMSKFVWNAKVTLIWKGVTLIYFLENKKHCKPMRYVFNLRIWERRKKAKQEELRKKRKCAAVRIWAGKQPRTEWHDIRSYRIVGEAGEMTGEDWRTREV